MEKPKLVIFDWDDTLIKTRNAVVKAMNYVLKLYNLPEWDIRDKNKSLKENFSNFFWRNRSGYCISKIFRLLQ